MISNELDKSILSMDWISIRSCWGDMSNLLKCLAVTHPGPGKSFFKIGVKPIIYEVNSNLRAKLKTVWLWEKMDLSTSSLKLLRMALAPLIPDST